MLIRWRLMETLAELLEIAEARLVEAQTSTQTLEITCLFMPLREHDAVRFVNRAAGLDRSVYCVWKVDSGRIVCDGCEFAEDFTAAVG